MDLTSTLIGLGLVLLTALPIFYFYYAQKNKTKQFLNGFIALANQHQVKISRHALWGHYSAIGLDESAQKLFFLRSREGREEKALIDLTEVENCRVLVHRRVLNEDQVIDRLELLMSFRNPKSPEKTLLFYSKDEEMTLNGELQLIEQWQSLISAKLAAKKRTPVLS